MENNIIEQGNKVYKIENIMDSYPIYQTNMTKKQMNQVVVPIRTEPKYYNNEPCHCGSGLKFKKCCKNEK